MSTAENQVGASAFAIIEALAAPLNGSVVVFNRDDTLMYASAGFRQFFPLPDECMKPGYRLRDFLGAIYDCGVRFGVEKRAAVTISRDDWIAERIAVHWRERYESIEQLADGRWLKLGKRRLPGGLLVTYTLNVTEQKKRDRDFVELRDQAQLAQHILDNLPNPVIVKDSSLRYVFVNAAFCRIMGLGPDRILGRSAGDLVGAEIGAGFEESERAVLQTGRPYEFVEDITHADGTVVRSITRKHRSGPPGNRYVTISVDRLGNAQRADAEVEIRQPAKARRKCRGRLLVVDENSLKADAQAAWYRREGWDAMALVSAEATLSFLRQAGRMGVKIDRVEASTAQIAAFAADPQARDYPALAVLLAPGDAAPKTTPEPDAPGDSGAQQPVAAVGPVEAKGAATPVRPAEKPRRVRVLVAEDNDVNQIVFEQILEAIDVDYRIVGNGEEAVAAWRDTRPDLILMDVSMPVMNGHQATKAIRDIEAQAGTDMHVPVLAVTAHAMAGDREQCFAAGMDDFLTKPVSPEKLEAAIATWLPGAIRATEAA